VRPPSDQLLQSPGERSNAVPDAVKVAFGELLIAQYMNK
jgi:hypothetical protein